MTPEEMFRQMLGLGNDWQVASCRFDPETGLVTLHIAETAQLWTSYRCPHDQREAFCYDHTEELVWRHLNVLEHKWEKYEGHRHQLTQVSMDMSKAYRAAVPEWCRN